MKQMSLSSRTSRTFRSSLAGLVAAAVLGITPIAFAPEAFAQEKTRLSPEERAEKRAARLEKKVRERLSPKLGLDASQEDQLLRALQDTARERREAMSAVKAERKALAALVEKGASERELSAQLSRLEAAQEKLPKRGALLERTGRFLSVEQQAKLALAEKGGKHGKMFKKGKKGKLFKKGKKGAYERGLDKAGAR